MQKRGPLEVEVTPFGKEESAQKQEIQTKKVVRRLLGKNFLSVWRIQLAASRMSQQKRRR